MAVGFQPPDLKNLVFPAAMLVDYVRVYQRRGIKNGVGCNPPDRPTADYINKYEFPRISRRMYDTEKTSGKAHGRIYESKFDNVGRRKFYVPQKFHLSWLHVTLLMN